MFIVEFYLFCTGKKILNFKEKFYLVLFCSISFVISQVCCALCYKIMLLLLIVWFTKQRFQKNQFTFVTLKTIEAHLQQSRNVLGNKLSGKMYFTCQLCMNSTMTLHSPLYMLAAQKRIHWETQWPRKKSVSIKGKKKRVRKWLYNIKCRN